MKGLKDRQRHVYQTLPLERSCRHRSQMKISSVHTLRACVWKAMRLAVHILSICVNAALYFGLEIVSWWWQMHYSSFQIYIYIFFFKVKTFTNTLYFYSFLCLLTLRTTEKWIARAGLTFVHIAGKIRTCISVSTTVFKCHEHSQAQMLFFTWLWKVNVILQTAVPI